jgi:serine/threonine protein kinase
MLCGTVPFKAPNMTELHELINKGKYTYPVWVSASMLAIVTLIDARSLIDGLMKRVPEQRLSIPGILSHPWMLQDDDSSEDESEEYNYYVILNDKLPTDATSSTPPSINNLNIENLYFPAESGIRMRFRDYCYIANDFYTHHLGKRD